MTINEINEVFAAFKKMYADNDKLKAENAELKKALYDVIYCGGTASEYHWEAVKRGKEFSTH